MSALTEYDDQLRQKYGDLICGCDEVGRGAFAGPLVAAAVVLDKATNIPRVRDSKALTDTSRRNLAVKIRAVALSYAIVEVDADLIDIYGIDWANRFAMTEASKLAAKDHKVGMFLVDRAPGFDLRPHMMMAKADAISECVAAASIIAKDHRDQLMIRLADEYPDYDFANSKGYVSKAHVNGAKLHGVIPHIHRVTFKVKGVTAPEKPTIWEFL